MEKYESDRTSWSVYQWAIVLLLLGALVISAIDKVNFSVAAPYWIKHHMMKPSEAGLIQAIFGWSLTLFLLISGPLIDKFHPRRVLPLGMLLWSLATWLTSVTIKIPLMIFSRILLGMGESTLLPSAPKFFVETIYDKDRSKAISIYFAGNKLGPTIGIPLSATILISFGWHAVFYVTGALSLIWLAIWLPIYRKDKVISEPSQPIVPQKPRVSWSALFAYRNTWALIIGQFGYLYVLFVFLTWLPGILILQEHLSIGKSGALSSLPFVVSIVTTLLGGWLADFWIVKSGRKTLVRKTIITSGLFLSTVCVIAASFMHTPSLTVLFLTLTMAALGIVTGSVNALPMDLAPPEMVSSVSSLQNFGGNLGASFAPLITGLVYGATHSFRTPLIITGVVALVGLAAYLVLLGKVERTYVHVQVNSTASSVTSDN